MLCDDHFGRGGLTSENVEDVGVFRGFRQDVIVHAGCELFALVLLLGRVFNHGFVQLTFGLDLQAVGGETVAGVGTEWLDADLGGSRYEVEPEFAFVGRQDRNVIGTLLAFKMGSEVGKRGFDSYRG